MVSLIDFTHMYSLMRPCSYAGMPFLWYQAVVKTLNENHVGLNPIDLVIVSEEVSVLKRSCRLYKLMQSTTLSSWVYNIPVHVSVVHLVNTSVIGSAVYVHVTPKVSPAFKSFDFSLDAYVLLASTSHTRR